MEKNSSVKPSVLEMQSLILSFFSAILIAILPLNPKRKSDALN